MTFNPEILAALKKAAAGQSDNNAEGKTHRKKQWLKLKEQVVVESKQNSDLEYGLKEFEQKISSSLQESVSDEDIAAASKRFASDKQNAEVTPAMAESLQRYGNLMYFLQSDPKYLANLVEAIPLDQADKLVQFIIFTLFPNPYDQFEENKLLKIIQFILQAIYDKTTDITAFMRENSCAPKLLTAYTRREPSVLVLKKVMAEPLQKVLKDYTLNLELNPMKILQGFLRNGKADVKTVDDPAVKAEIAERTESAKQVCESLLTSIFSSELSLGMRLVARTLRDMVEHGHVQSDQVTNVNIADSLVGGLVFLRYISPAIINPRLALDKPVDMPSTVRRNVVMVTKILQNLSNGVLFGEKEQFMQTINPYLESKLKPMHDFFGRVTDLPTLDEHIAVESQLEQDSSGAIIYLSLRELKFSHDILLQYLDKVAPAQDDPLRGLLTELEGYTLQNIATTELDKYATVTINNLSKGVESKFSAVTDKQSANDKLLSVSKAMAIVLLRAASALKDAELDALFTELNAAGSMVDAIPVLCAKVTSMAPDEDTQREVKTLTDALDHAKASGATISDGALQDGVLSGVNRQKMLSEKLDRDLKTMTEALTQISKKRTYLKSQRAVFKDYLRNIQDQTFYKLGWQAGDAIPEDTAQQFNDKKETKLISLESALSSSGLIGGLLRKVQQDVAQMIKKHLHVSAPELLFRPKEEKSDLNDNETLFFPRTCSFYENAMATISSIGKSCVADLAYLLIKSLPACTKLGIQLGADNQANASDFSWASFLQLVPNLNMVNKDHADLFDCVVDTLAADMLCAVCQHINAKTVLPEDVVDAMLKIGMHMFQESKPRKLSKNLWVALRSHVRDKWAIIFGQISNCNVTKMMGVLEKTLYVEAYKNDQIQTRVSTLRGMRYIQFPCNTEQNVKELETYLSLELKMLDTHTKAAKSSDAVLLQKEHLRNLSNVFRQVDFTTVSEIIDMKISEDVEDEEDEMRMIEMKMRREGAKKLVTFWDEYMPQLWTRIELLALGKVDDVRTDAINVMSTVIMHAPSEFYEKRIGDFVQTTLVKNFGKDKKRLESDMQRILFFLRGGGSESVQLPGVNFFRDRPIDRVAQIFGFGKYKLAETFLAMIYETVFVKKTCARHPEVSRIAERIVVQMAFHQFKYVATGVVIPALCKSKHVSEQLVGLRALEILIDKRSGFTEFCVSWAPEEGLDRQRMLTTILALSSDVVPMVLQLIVQLDALVGLKTLKLNTAILFPPVNSDGDASTRYAYLEWIDQNLYDLRSEKLLPELDFRRRSISQSNKGKGNYHIDLYYHALRLFPGVMPEPILATTPENCSMDGLFIGKLLCHPDTVIAVTAFEGLKRVILNYPDERSQLMNCFVLLLRTAEFQDPHSLTTLLKHLVNLLRLWTSRVKLEDVVSRLRQTKVQESTTPEDLLAENCDKARWPAWLRWVAGTDSIALFFVGHTDSKVRLAAYEVLRAVQHIIGEFIRIKTGGVCKPSAARAYSLNCVADVLDVYEHVIMGAGTKQYHCSLFTDLDDSYRKVTGKPIVSFKGMIVQSTTPASLRAACVALAGYICVETGRFRNMLSTTRTFLIDYISRFPTLPLEDEGKKVTFNEDTQNLWVLTACLLFGTYGDASFFSKPAVNRADLTYLRGKLAQFLQAGWWKCLVSEVDWVRNGASLAIMSMHSSCIPPLITNLASHYDTLKTTEKKKSKIALVRVTQLYQKAAQGYGFSHALQQDKKKEILPVFKDFILQTQAQLWDPKKLVKSKWSTTQLDLVRVVTHFCSAIDRVDEKHVSMYFDDNGNVIDWTLEERFLMFRWLIEYAQKPEETSSSVSHDEKDSAERFSVIRATCANALRHFCSLGVAIPDAEIGKMIQKGLLPLILKIDDDEYFLLSVLLCYHTKYLFPLCVDRLYTSDEVQSKVFFRAIAEPFISEIRQMNASTHRSIKDLINPCRLRQAKAKLLETTGRGKLGQLIYCALFELISDDYQTRYNAFSMIVDVATVLISPELGAHLKENYRFTFEGHISQWARSTALRISEDIAKSSPDIAFQLFREACSCLKTKKSAWIPELLMPWAKHIILCSSLDESTMKESIQDESKKEGWYAFGNNHTSLRFLSQLFDLSTSGVVPVEQLLPIYRTLAENANNVIAIFEFMVQRVTDFGVDTVPLCKTILFTVYEREQHRDSILLSITKYLLRVLRTNAAELSSSNLKNRLAGFNILSVLESYDSGLQSVTSAHDFAEYDRGEDDDEDSTATSESKVPSRTSIKSPPKPQGAQLALSKEKLQKQSHVVAALLVELIGVSITPVMPYYSVIFMYAMLHLQNQDRFVQNTMHKLLVRLFCAFCKVSLNDADSSDDPYTGVSIIEALRSETLIVNWHKEDKLNFVSGQNTVVISSESFVSQYAQAFEKVRPGSLKRIGYEALRWGVLSTSVNICDMAHGVYRTLLQPMNEACLYALMSSLLGAVEDWERHGWYRNENLNINLSRSKREVLIIIDTLIQVLHVLAEQNKLSQQPSLFWVSVALLRADDDDVYHKALKMMLVCQKHYHYLFNYDAKAISSNAMTSHVSEADEKRNSMPEDFWTFPERWAPSFEGIQPYLLRGLHVPKLEEVALQAIQRLLLTRVDALFDQAKTRNLTTLISTLPWLYHTMIDEEKRLYAMEVMRVLALSQPNPVIKEILNRGDQITNRDEFLSELCAEITISYGIFMPQICEMLHAVLVSDFKEYHVHALLIVNKLLSQPNAVEYVHNFQEIISFAHEAVTRTTNARDRGSVQLSRRSIMPAVVKQNDAKKEELGLYYLSLAGPAADIVASVIYVVNASPDELQRRNSSLAAANSGKRHHRKKRTVAQVAAMLKITRVLPSHSLKNVVSALKEVVRCSPMFSEVDQPQN